MYAALNTGENYINIPGAGATVRPGVVAIPARRFVNYNGELLTATAAATAPALGVSTRNIPLNELGSVERLGSPLVESGGAYVAGNLVTNDSQGRAVLTTDATLAHGRADQDSTGAGQPTKIFLLPR